MDWIKIKPQHHLFSDLTEHEGYALVKIQCLTAHLESYPTRQQILKVVHHATYKSLDEKLMKSSCNLHDILMKVLCDVDEVAQERKAWRERKKKQRASQKNVPREVTVTSPDREDKIREDKIRESTVYINNGSTPSSLQEVKKYIKEKRYKTNAEKFFSYYEAKGWKDIKNWKAILDYWGSKDGTKPREYEQPEWMNEAAIKLARQAAERMGS